MSIMAIPTHAPFSDLQRAWLAGYLAGLTDGARDSSSGAASDAPPILIAYGTQTGNALSIAEDLAAKSTSAGLRPSVMGLDELSIEQLTQTQRLLLVTSTYGEGEMPDNAELFWEELSAADATRLESLSFAVLALGDTGYDGFCQAGRLIDTRLEQLGGTRLAERVDCDVDFEEAAEAWSEQVVGVVAAAAGATSGAGNTGASVPSAGPKSKWGRKNPYASRLVANRVLSGPGSAKEIRHLELDLADSGITYAAGDALAVVPTNDPALVEALLTRLGVSGDAPIKNSTWADYLSQQVEIRTPSKDLLAHMADATTDTELRTLLHHGEPTDVAAWLWGRDVLDLLDLTDIDPEIFAELLRPLQPRSYSISSSPLEHPDRIHLTVAAVRHIHGKRQRGGVASTYLSDRADTGQTGIFLQPNAGFRPPADDTAAIMIGPGTGIAPFRAFLQDRRARGDSGRNWLFFGDQHREHDFIYADELEQFSSDGVLDRLNLAFSRDQADKIYVQTQMREHGADLYAWLADGAHLYVCGDASRMAKDVDDALTNIVARHGSMTADEATAWVSELKRAKRYLRDVY